MLYVVEWELISWGGGMCNYLAELSEDELKDLELYFEGQHKIHKLMNYRITPADIKGLASIMDIHQDDRRAEEELDKQIDEENKKKGA